MFSRKAITFAFAALLSVSMFAATSTPASALWWLLDGGKTTKQTVSFKENYKAGTIIIKTGERRLYLVQGKGKALMYKIGVGRPGFTWKGRHRVTRKAEWPGWTPPPAMRKREPWLPAYMPGGPENPMGARALYLGSSIYRIHGTNQRKTIGQAVSSGCFRMMNDDVADLYNRVKVGTRVVVL